jgi:hypothetical protein
VIFYLATAVPRDLSAALARIPLLAAHVTVLPYARVLDARRVRAGTYVFADLERLSPEDTARATALWSALAAAGVRVLNHPALAMRSYELLRSRRERGLAAGDAIRLDEARLPARYPVALRDAAGGGWLGGSIADAAALARAADDLVRRGISRSRLMLVELADPGSAHAALVVGERVLAIDALEDPHAAALRAACRDARIDLARVDYGVRDGHVQVWGIDTAILPTDRPAFDTGALAEAFAALDSAGAAAGWIATGLAPRHVAPAALRRLGARVRERMKEASDRLPRR